MNKNKKNNGFTLVELLAVTVILIIIIFIAVTRVRNSTAKSRLNSIKADAITYIKAANDFASVDNLTSSRLKDNALNLDDLEELGIKVSGEKPKSAIVSFNDFEVNYACLTYGKYYVEYQDGNYNDPVKGTCPEQETNKEVLAEYNYSGNYETFTATRGGYYAIELWGAASGTPWHTNIGSSGGGYAYGEIKLDPGDKLYIYVGQMGLSLDGTNSFGGPVGGWNGGGAGGNRISYSGGGATDVRLVSGAWNDVKSLASRIMVAGGGGGSDDNSSATNDGRGGAGGGINSIGAWIGSTYHEEYRATQTSGSNFGYASNVTSNADTGGAGGGYYGGLVTNHGNGGAGGGSGFISGLKGCVAIKSSTDTSPRLDANGEVCADGTTDITCSKHYSGKVFRNAKLIAGDKSMPDYESETNGKMIGNIKDGHARITFIRF